jgi:hypothetical protein
MSRLYLVDSGETLGKLTEDQLDCLVDLLEEEHPEDRDYYINRDTLDMLKDQGCDEGLLALLEKALEGKEEVDVAWDEGE